MTEFNLSTVFDTVAKTVPDREVLVWRDRRLCYRESLTKQVLGRVAWAGGSAERPARGAASRAVQL
jgi:hypothetical protein